MRIDLRGWASTSSLTAFYMVLSKLELGIFNPCPCYLHVIIWEWVNAAVAWSDPRNLESIEVFHGITASSAICLLTLKSIFSRKNCSMKGLFQRAE